MVDRAAMLFFVVHPELGAEPESWLPPDPRVRGASSSVAEAGLVISSGPQ